ncbi:MAG: aldo/keto reductase [Planctomycetota bacterium]
MPETNRRTFLKTAAVAAGAVGTGVVPHAAAQQADPPKPGQITQRRLGKLNTRVGVLGAGLGSVFTRSHRNAEEAAATLTRALDAGVNYFDTARSYGPSEELIGPFVKQRRDDIFLVSKSGWRDHDGFRRQLEQSLKNLQTDSIDLYHLHNLKPNRDGDLAEIERGAVAAARKAKEEGLIKAFGVTGHTGADILMRAIDAWDPDALLTVFNVNRSDAGRYEDELLPMAIERDLAIVGMKAIRHVRDADLPGPDLVRYAISLQGVHSVIVGLDTAAHLDANVAMATNFQPMAPAAMREMSDEASLALGGHPAPWERPGYIDGVAEV